MPRAADLFADAAAAHTARLARTPARATPDAASVPGAEPSQRRVLGAFYTPTDVVEALLDRVLDPALAEAEARGTLHALRVCDPACGAGAFLGAAARRLKERFARAGLDAPERRAAEAIHGFDVDPEALSLCASTVAAATGGHAPAHLRVADALLEAPDGAYDVVVGNPPFLGQLTSDTARSRARAAALRARWGPVAGGYADTSAVFLVAAARMLRPGGRLALVQPHSVLAARDAGPARDALLTDADLTGFWWSDDPLFEGTAVRVCALLARRRDPKTDAAAPGPSEPRDPRAAAPKTTPDALPTPRWHGRAFEPCPAAPAPRAGRSWAALLAIGVPTPPSPIGGVLSDLCAVTADFRDAYYGLLPAVREASEVRAALGLQPGAPLPTARWAPVVTTGRVDPAALQDRPVRYGRRAFAEPVADLSSLDGAMAAWAARRRVPKVLVATQSPRIEALADPDGALLPVTPVVTVACSGEEVWRASAVLLGPPATAWGLTHCAGTALAAGTLKMSASALRSLPLPTRSEAWAEAAEAARRAHRAAGPVARAEALAACEAAMCAAYEEVDGYDAAATLRWWKARRR